MATNPPPLALRCPVPSLPAARLLPLAALGGAEAAGPGAMPGGGAGLRLALLGARRAAALRGAAAGSGAAAMVRPGRGRALRGRAAISGRAGPGPFLPAGGAPRRARGCSFSVTTAWLIGRAN